MLAVRKGEWGRGGEEEVLEAMLDARGGLADVRRFAAEADILAVVLSQAGNPSLVILRYLQFA